MGMGEGAKNEKWVVAGCADVFVDAKGTTHRYVHYGLYGMSNPIVLTNSDSWFFSNTLP
jgi:hypothetical protein